MDNDKMYVGKRIDNGDSIQGYFFKVWEQTFILWGTTNGIPNMHEVYPDSVISANNK